MKIARGFAAIVLALGLTAYARSAEWPTFGHDAARGGENSDAGALSSKAVSHLRLRWRTALRAVADSQPIYLSHVTVNGRSVAMLFLTSKDGTTNAIDARSGRIAWRFATHGPGITTSVPVADPSGRWIYAPGDDGSVHKLETATGMEMRAGGFPVQITQIPSTEKNAASLNLANGYLYAVTSGYLGDAPPYVGHVVAINVSSGSSRVFNTLCNRQRTLAASSKCQHSGSGMWSRAGVVVDPDPSMGGRIYVATGNGTFDANRGGDDYGDSVLAISRDGSRLLGYYTPANFQELQEDDTDIGSTSPALLPRETRSRTPLMAVQGGKDGALRLLDRAHLGGVGSELQRVHAGSGIYSAPAVWRDNKGMSWIFLGLSGGVRAFRLLTDADGKSQLVEAWSTSTGETPEGTSPAVSNGIVFVAMNGAIIALDARTGTRLWSSAQPSAGSSIGATHWQSPIVVDGWLYCSDQDGNISAYGL